MEEFNLKTSISFGADSLNVLEYLAYSNIFIVTDSFMMESGMIDKVTVHLKNKRFTVFGNVIPDPPLTQVAEGVKSLLDFGPDAVVALGGGSVIDAAKAIVYFAGKAAGHGVKELIAVPTTSGTGSEVTSFAVITDKEKGIKYPLVSRELLPGRAILDPQLLKTLPAFIVADTGMDVLTHALEAYVSTKANAFTDALAEKAALLTFRYLLRSFKSGEDAEAREQMHYASCLAGLAFDQTSLGVSHAIAHNIGGRFAIPHGRANAVLLPHVVAFNAQLTNYEQKCCSQAATKYATLAKTAGFGGESVRAGVKNLIHQIQKLMREMHMPTGFQGCKIRAEEYRGAEDLVIAGALADGCLSTNPRAVTAEDVRELLRHSYA